MPLSAPPSMEKEHQDIWQLFMGVQNLPGKTGAIAGKLAKELKLHIDKEESLALPLLGILRDLADGKLSASTAKRASIVSLRFEKEYPGMLHGHKELYKLLERLRDVADKEGHLTAVRFAVMVEKHSQEEEEVLYPAAILAGRTASRQAKTKS